MKSQLKGFSKRWKDIRQIHSERKVFYRLFVGSLLLFALIGLGASRYVQNENDLGYETNLFTEALGVYVSIGITVFLIDILYELRDRDRLRARLIREAGSRSNAIAIGAVEWLRAEGWLCGEDGLLKGENLVWANLKRANLYKANLIDCNLVYARLQRADMRHAKLNAANLFNAKLQRTYLMSAVLDGADLRKAILNGAFLYNASLQNCADLMEARMEKAKLNDAKLHDATLYRAELSQATMRYAIFHRANMGSANLKGTDLYGADLFSAFLERADLRKSDLSSANLEGADLRHAKMQGALIYGAKLRGAYMEGANVTNLRLYPKHHFRNMLPEDCLLPDGSPYTDDLTVEDFDRFTNRDNDDFECTLEDVKKRRQELELED